MAQRILTSKDLAEIELIVRKFGNETKESLSFQLNSLDLRSKADVFAKIKDHNGVKKHLADSIKVKLKRRFGQVDAVVFSYNWYGLFHDIGAKNVFGKGLDLPALEWRGAAINPPSKLLADKLQNFYANIALNAIVFEKNKKNI